MMKKFINSQETITEEELAGLGLAYGDILTVEGEHSNTGTSIWNNVTIGEGGAASNGEALAPDAPKGHEEG